MKTLANLVFLLGCLLLAGCATTSPAPPPPAEAGAAADADTGEADVAWQTPLLYLLAAPSPRLYVEVESVAGCAPRDATLNRLRDFLTTYCEKPDGIEIVRSQVISRAEARGLPPRALARKFLHGPPETPGVPAPAYLYVLYYDSDLGKKPYLNGTNHWAASALPQNLHPHADLGPYPAIFMNVRYGFQKWVPNEMLLHEAGHALGLVSRPDFATNHHCIDVNCLMNPTIHISLHRALFGEHPTTQIQLCGRCMNELVQRLKQPPLTNLYFAGPVMVRAEPGYAVLTLPNRVGLIVGEVTPQDCRDFAADIRAESPAPGDNELRYRGMAKDEILNDPVRLRETIERAKADPLPWVRRTAAELWRQAQEHQPGVLSPSL